MKLENFIKGPLTSILGLVLMVFAFYAYAISKEFTAWQAGGVALVGFLLGFMRLKLEDFVSEFIKAAIDKFKNKTLLLIVGLAFSTIAYSQSTDADLTNQVNTTVRGKIYNATSSGNMYQSIIDSKTPRPVELGQIISDDFNRGSLGANWTNVGTATFTISGNALSMSRTGAISLSNYLVWNAYGNSNLESYTVNFSITAGTIDANSHGAGLTLQSNGGYTGQTNSVQIGVDMTNTANQGKISYYYQNSTTAILTSPNGLAITAGDVLNVKVKFIKDRFITTVYNVNTRRMNTQIYDVLSSFPYSLITPNSFRYGPVVMGGTHTIDNFVVVGNDNKNAKILAAGHSITKGLTVDNLQSRWTEMVNNYTSEFVLTNAGAGNLIEDINPNELIALKGQILILDLGINNLAKGDAPATVVTKYQTLVASLVSGGYTLGTNLFIGLILPNLSNNAAVNTTNPLLISWAGAACIDWASPNLNAAGTGLRYSVDTTHPTRQGQEIMSGAVINTFPLIAREKKIGNNNPIYYNPNGFVRIANDQNGSGTPLYQLDLVNTTGTVLHVSNNGNNEGAFFGSINANNVYMAGGAFWNGANWTYRNATSSSYSQSGGVHYFSIDAGKTIGTSGAATTIMQLSSTALTMTAGVKILAATNTTTAGINTGSFTADPSTLVNFDVWGNSTSNLLKARINGVSQDFVFATSTQTLTNKTLSTGTTISVAPTITAGVKITTGTNGTNPGLNLGSVATDPTTRANGDVWYNSTENVPKVQAGGAAHPFGFVRRFNTSLTHTQIINSFTTPITILTSGTAGGRIVILGSVVVKKLGTAIFGTNFTCQLACLGHTWTGVASSTQNIMSSASDNLTEWIQGDTGFLVPTGVTSSNDIVFSTTVGNPTLTSGTGTFDITFYYIVVP